MSAPRFEIVTTDTAQPYHVRVIAPNGEPLFTSENLTEVHSCYAAIISLAGLLGVAGAGVIRAPGSFRDLVGTSGHGARISVPVVLVDETGATDILNGAP